MQVIARANKSEYGLASGIISNDVGFVNTVSRSLKAGTVWGECPRGSWCARILLIMASWAACHPSPNPEG